MGEERGPILTVHMQAIELAIFKGVQTPPPPDTRTLHMPYMYSVYVKTVGTSSHPERGWSEGSNSGNFLVAEGRENANTT